MGENSLDRCAGTVRNATQNTRVYNDECMFSFDTPLAPNGLFVNMNTFQGFGKDFVVLDHQRTGQQLYLHIKWDKVEKQPEAESESESVETPDSAAAAAAPTKLGIGIEGGFSLNDANKFETIKHYSLALVPEMRTIALDSVDLDPRIRQSADSIIAHTGFKAHEDLTAFEIKEDLREVSKYADSVEQLPAQHKINPDPASWKCEICCNARENLWLNLSTGKIGCGRRFWDGSGGNDGAVKHYEATGNKFPLVVKLGTITPTGADIYSYAPDENKMVLDPKLSEHLEHWGIAQSKMTKTDKTLSEMEVEAQNFELSRVLESGKQLHAVAGPGRIGLHNIGNSCYIDDGEIVD